LDHYKSNGFVLTDMRVTEENMMVFSNSLDPNEMPCDTASHCDLWCLKVKNNGFRDNCLNRKNPEISGKSREIVGLLANVPFSTMLLKS